MVPEYEYNYEKIIEDSEELYIQDDYTKSEWENYYHNLAEDIE